VHKEETQAVSENDNNNKATTEGEEEQATIAYYYLPDQNEAGAHYPGVPLRDLTKDEYEAHPKWIQRSIAASPMYSEDKPHKPSAKAPATEKSAPKKAGGESEK
jgi:hypothetical protein